MPKGKGYENVQMCLGNALISKIMKLNSIHCLKIKRGINVFDSSSFNVYWSKIELLAYCLPLEKSTCNYNNVGPLEESNAIKIQSERYEDQNCKTCKEALQDTITKLMLIHVCGFKQKGERVSAT